MYARGPRWQGSTHVLRSGLLFTQALCCDRGRAKGYPCAGPPRGIPMSALTDHVPLRHRYLSNAHVPPDAEPSCRTRASAQPTECTAIRGSGVHGSTDTLHPDLRGKVDMNATHRHPWTPISRGMLIALGAGQTSAGPLVGLGSGPSRERHQHLHSIACATDKEMLVRS